MTLLSNQLADSDSLSTVAHLGSRKPAADGDYGMAVAGGKNISFPILTRSGGGAQVFGTDGGVHNFLRCLEALGRRRCNRYHGSLVSLYYL